MKRWVLLGLVGLARFLQGHGEPEPEPPPVTTPQDCSTTGEQGLTSDGLGSDELDGKDGRQSFLIRYRRNVSAMAARAAEDTVTRAGGRVTASWERLGTVAARLTPEQRAALAQDPDVLSLEPDRVVHAFARQALAHHAGSVGEYTDGLKLVQAPQVWDANEDGVLDTSAPNGRASRCVSSTAAGTTGTRSCWGPTPGARTSSTTMTSRSTWRRTPARGAAATARTPRPPSSRSSGAHGTVNPGEEPNGVVGVAPGVELYVARVLDTRGNGSTADIVSALEWCQEQRREDRLAVARRSGPARDDRGGGVQGGRTRRACSPSRPAATVDGDAGQRGP